MSKHTKGKLALNIWGGPDSCRRLQGTKQVHVVKKCRCQLGRNRDKAVWDSPLWLFMQMWKTNTAGQDISNAWDRFVWISPSLSLALSFFSQPPFGHTSFHHFSALTLSQCCFPAVSLCLYGEFDIKNWTEAWFPSLSSPTIPLTKLMCVRPTPQAHGRSHPFPRLSPCLPPGEPPRC